MNTIIIVHKIVAVIAVYTNSIDYYYCTVVHTNSTKTVHVCLQCSMQLLK